VVIPFDDISSPDEFCKTDPASEFNRGPQRTQDSVNSIPHPKSLVGWLPDRWLAQRPIKKNNQEEDDPIDQRSRLRTASQASDVGSIPIAQSINR